MHLVERHVIRRSDPRFTVIDRAAKASFLDADPLPLVAPLQPAPVFSGRRVKRGLYRAAGGRYINAM
jgi:hypothetical protein